MRHLVAAVTVIVLSIALAAQWMPEAQAKRAPDPAAALRKRAQKAVKKDLKSALREIRANARDTAKEIRAIAKAVKKGKALPAKAVDDAKRATEIDRDGAVAAIFLMQALLGDDDRHYTKIAADRQRELEQNPDLVEYMGSNLTARECLPGAGGLCDQITADLQAECDAAYAVIGKELAALVGVLRSGGHDVTALTFPTGRLRPAGLVTNETVADFLPSFVYAVGFENLFNGTVRVPLAHVGNQTASYLIECYTPAGALAGSCSLGRPGPTGFVDFSCPVREPGTYRLALVSDCDDCCPVAAECWLGMGGTQGGSRPPSENLFDFSASSCTATVDGGRAIDLDLTSALVDSTSDDTYGGITFQWSYAGSRDPALYLVVTYDPRSDGVTTKSTTTISTTATGVNPSAVLDFSPSGSATYPFSSATPPPPVRKVDEEIQVTFDRDVAAFFAGRPNARIKGSVTVRDDMGASREIVFDARVSRDDVTRP